MLKNNVKPNILMIACDQLAWRALPAYGNSQVETPNIDRIAGKAVVFKEAYTPCPLCMPARTSFWTGRLPHETGVKSNGGRYDSPVSIPDDMATMGTLLSSAGYRTIHFGKTHDSGALRGFEIVPLGNLPVESPAAWPASRDTTQDRHTTDACVSWLKDEPVSEQPWAVVCDLNNPHDICSWIGTNQGEHVDTPLPQGYDLPELPDNYTFDDIENRPIAVRYLCCSHNRQAQTSEWTPENFRYYLAAYYEYLRKADREIGLVLDALEQRGDLENTLIVFWADHGEGMASRRHVTKQVSFYEELTHVPLMFAGCGVQGGREAGGYPVSLLDLVPTICDVAGVEAPTDLQGISLLPVIEDSGNLPEREYVSSEWTTEWGFTTSPGRMIRTKNFKYTKYIEDCRPHAPVFMPVKPGSIDDGTGEELFDLVRDPMEKINLAKDPTYADVLLHHRELLIKQLAKSGDPFINERSWAGKRWRSHELGYEKHCGASAPEFMMKNDGDFPFVINPHK